MLHLYQSNRLETLLTLLRQLAAVPLADPLAPEQIVVQSKGMGRWLAFELAHSQGVAANLEVNLPASFVWKLMQATLGDLPRRSAYNPEVLVWRILPWLERESAAHPRLAAYLAGGDARRAYQLASHVASVIDQYLVYRPDWLAAWEAGQILNLGPDEGWQAALWRNLALADNQHRANWLNALLHHPQLARHLPERITLFGISSLPPVYFDLFEALAQKIDVCIFALNPCAQFWGDLQNPTRLSDDLDPHTLRLEVGNPLLAGMGRQGRAFFDRLAGMSELHDLFVPAEPRHLLACLQQDVLELVERDHATAWPLAAEDDSLTIAVCHSAQREVEALHDELLRCFAADASLKPDEIVVLCPDIKSYAPYIEAVFAHRPGLPWIPYAIADRGGQAEAPLIATFLELLNLPQSRFGADEILALLETPALRRAFGIEEADLPRLQAWVAESGIRWGRDARHREKLGLPADATHTWRFGLDRLLLGLCLPEAAPQTWQGIAPLAHLAWSDQALVGRLVRFFETLAEFADRLAVSQTPAAWQACLLELLERSFAGDEDELDALARIRSALGEIHECAAMAGFDGEAPLAWLRDELSAMLDMPSGAGGFLSGGVTFCTLTPMRSLPFRRIAVLGLADGAFPRNKPAPGFDLMAQKPRQGDRLRRLDDRYLFLETLLSARDGLYLSYTGRDARDNSAIPPSVLVADLLDVVLRSAVPADAGEPPQTGVREWRARQADRLRSCIVREHRLQAAHPDYFRASSLPRSFDAKALAVASAPTRELACLHTALPALDMPATLTLDELSECFANTSRFFLRQRLGVQLPWLADGPASDEPFAIDYSGRERIRLLAAAQGAEAAAYAQAAGLVPHGVAGDLALQREVSQGLALAAALDPQPRALAPQILNLEIDGLPFSACLNQLTDQGQVFWVAGKIKPRHILRAWLAHLALLCHDPAAMTRLVGEGEVLNLPVPNDPRQQLARWLHYWKAAWCEPLPFFPKASAGYAGMTGKGEEAAFKAARKEWQAVEFKREGWEMGECEDRWHALVWREADPLDVRFAELAGELWPKFTEDAE